VADRCQAFTAGRASALKPQNNTGHSVYLFYGKKYSLRRV